MPNTQKMSLRDLVIVRIVSGIAAKIWIAGLAAILVCFIVYFFYGTMTAFGLLALAILCKSSHFQPSVTDRWLMTENSLSQVCCTRHKIVYYIIRKYRHNHGYSCRCHRCTVCPMTQFTFGLPIMWACTRTGSGMRAKRACLCRRWCIFTVMPATWATGYTMHRAFSIRYNVICWW